MKNFALVNGNLVINIVVAEEKPSDVLLGSFIEYNEDTNIAEIDGTYDFENNKFISKQPFASWTLNTENFKWQAPIEKPQNATVWNEESQSWITPE
jgi:hypothetical protein